VSKESFAVGLGKVFFSYAEERSSAAKPESLTPRPKRFVRDNTDTARLLPRLRKDNL
jgi:hypothetical protein